MVPQSSSKELACPVSQNNAKVKASNGFSGSAIWQLDMETASGLPVLLRNVFPLNRNEQANELILIKMF